MTLTCPHCGYSRELPTARQPAVTVRVTCPRCREQFQWVARESDAILPEAEREALPPAAEVPDSAAGSQPDPARASVWPKAGFWMRGVAAVVDSALVTTLQVVCGIALIAAAVILTGGHNDEARALGMLIAWSFGPVLGVAYYVGFTGYCGQTPGKMALRIKVIRCDGHDLGYGRAFLRETLGKFASMLIFGIGYLMIAFDRQKQGLHDKIADTYVVKL